MKKKTLFVVVWLLVLAVGISYLFWFQEWKYSLPTPVPQNYLAVNAGTTVSIKEIPGVPKDNKPLFLHFFNPDCPCSRFNMTHFKSLVKEYGDQLNFAVITLGKKDRYTDTDIQRKFGIDLPVVFDSSYAAACGVYSTPQAAIITPAQQLYYRGNYNKSRYCTDKKSNYAQIAIEALLQKKELPGYGPAATKSYGCVLPVCTR